MNEQIITEFLQYSILYFRHILQVWEELVDKEAHDDKTSDHSFVDMSQANSKAVVEFTATKAAVLEKEGRVRVGLRRYGKTNTRVLFKLVTFRVSFKLILGFGHLSGCPILPNSA